jgi:hypothetical protein
MYCGTAGISNISVTNALPTSLYTWTTNNGHIVGNNIGPEITVDQPGDYVVTQELMDSCGASYAKDTVTVTLDPNCTLLKTMVKDFKSYRNNKVLQLNWKVLNNHATSVYEIERSIGNSAFAVIGKVLANGSTEPIVSYTYNDVITELQTSIVYYRLKYTDKNGRIQYSQIIAENIDSEKTGIQLLRNGVSGAQSYLSLSSSQTMDVKVEIYNQAGATLKSSKIQVQKGVSIVPLEKFENQPGGVYFIKVMMGDIIFSDKIILVK